MMISERELWVCACSVLEQDGEFAPAFVAQRIGDLLTTGDRDGVAMWKAVGRRLHELMQGCEQVN